jgi:choline dehydrogenase-like flavoprotein
MRTFIVADHRQSGSRRGNRIIGYVLRGFAGKSALRKALQKHFEGVQLGEMVTAAREFPIISRVDVQTGPRSNVRESHRHKASRN